MFHRTRALVAGAVLVAVAAPAFAGGFAPVATETFAPAPVPVVVTAQAAPSGDWTGLYLGRGRCEGFSCDRGEATGKRWGGGTDKGDSQEGEKLGHGMVFLER